MPFTPSHAVVALPFIRTPLVPAAVAIGAMTPDLPLFLRAFPLGYGRMHDAAWLPVTIMVAIALVVLWRVVFRPAIAELSPQWLASRLPETWQQCASASLRETFVGTRGPVLTTILLVVSAAIGIATHIAWDAFTHEGRGGVSLLPVLDDAWGPLVGYKWLQYGSGIAGLAILGIAGLVWIRRRRQHAVPRHLPNPIRWAWWLSLPITLVGACALHLAVVSAAGGAPTMTALIYGVLVPATAVWGLLTLAGCVIALIVREARTRR